MVIAATTHFDGRQSKRPVTGVDEASGIDAAVQPAGEVHRGPAHRVGIAVGDGAHAAIAHREADGLVRLEPAARDVGPTDRRSGRSTAVTEITGNRNSPAPRGMGAPGKPGRAREPDRQCAQTRALAAPRGDRSVMLPPHSPDERLTLRRRAVNELLIPSSRWRSSASQGLMAPEASIGRQARTGRAGHTARGAELVGRCRPLVRVSRAGGPAPAPRGRRGGARRWTSPERCPVACWTSGAGDGRLTALVLDA